MRTYAELSLDERRQLLQFIGEDLNISTDPQKTVKDILEALDITVNVDEIAMVWQQSGHHMQKLYDLPLICENVCSPLRRD